MSNFRQWQPWFAEPPRFSVCLTSDSDSLGLLNHRDSLQWQPWFAEPPRFSVCLTTDSDSLGLLNHRDSLYVLLQTVAALPHRWRDVRANFIAGFRLGCCGLAGRID
ncbi:hypothetical protein RRG08_049398 [Elysia crispata]|uniref:Uncharacterized protein n=1 Tax=Elysia crispata TaxID=231223 RepID=A0AAE0XE17_9GAST|nr:hypothetical protein RRG08_049398 [Elysia crispata]